MDQAEQLRGKRDSYSVKLREFIIAYGKTPERLFCFFEGEDEKYYGVRIDHLIPDSNYAKLECKGKDNLLRLHDVITKQEKYQSAWLAFFIDKDFDSKDELPKGPYLYCTPYYSIENFYISLSAFQKIIKAEFKISDISEETEEEFKNLCKLYQENLEKFHDAIEEFNMWLLLQRQKKKEGQEQQLNLNSIKLNDFVSVNIENIKKLYTLSDLNSKFPDAVPIEQLNNFQDKLNWIKTQRDERWKIFRGKYELEFMRVFLLKLQQDAVSKKPKCFKQKRTVSFTLSKNNIISELSQYADTPNCLRHFLGQLKEKGIKSNTNS